MSLFFFVSKTMKLFMYPSRIDVNDIHIVSIKYSPRPLDVDGMARHDVAVVTIPRLPSPRFVSCGREIRTSPW